MIGSLRQTRALFLDAYRELNARKLFWISLLISGIVVGAFAAAGINARGITFLWWTFQSDFLNSRNLPPELLYKFIFANLAIPIWLAWAATILGLVTTASMIPDFIAGGAVELTLSKPIGRARLIFTKFVAALLFMALQVTVFTAACFLVIGLRGNAWEPRLFLAVPIMILFFSFLYSVCALLGLLTRSTIAALMLTILFWLFIFGVNATEETFLSFKVYNELRGRKIETMIESAEAKIAKNQEAIESLSPADTDRRKRFEDALVANEAERANLQKQLESNTETGVWFGRGQALAYGVKTVLPKTSETVGLLNRSLMRAEDFERLHPPSDMPAFGFRDDNIRVRARDVEKRKQEVQRERSLGWVLGTSIAFEGVILLLLVRIFSRRDF